MLKGNDNKIVPIRKELLLIRVVTVHASRVEEEVVWQQVNYRNITYIARPL